ncbi:unnamed protein product [Symbiodinium natans]|uniref:Smr domain-containing protein n=1 Tax=Symbiodinium natans TaxID=878477 RepID=A0A812HI98_9DINO|nr:unnamed protein product [Symbiodinium natans]
MADATVKSTRMRSMQERQKTAQKGWSGAGQRSQAFAGACVEKGGGCDEDAQLRDHLDVVFADGCREGHPTLQHTWPRESEIGMADGYAQWLDRLDSRSMARAEVISWASLLECPAAACASLAVLALGAAGSVSAFVKMVELDTSEETQKFILDAARRMQFCYDELLTNTHQQRLFGYLGMIVAALELALAHLRSWSHEIRPRNPHHEDGRTVWHDYYSGLYPPVNYSEQFETCPGGFTSIACLPFAWTTADLAGVKQRFLHISVWGYQTGDAEGSRVIRCTPDFNFAKKHRSKISAWSVKSIDAFIDRKSLCRGRAPESMLMAIRRRYLMAWGNRNFVSKRPGFSSTQRCSDFALVRPFVLQDVLQTSACPAKALTSKLHPWQQSPKAVTDALQELKKLKRGDLMGELLLVLASEKGRQWAMALQLFSSMPLAALCFGSASMKPNVITFCASINACARAALWQAAVHLFSSMPDAQVIPNVISYNATISCCEKGGHWQAALQLFASLPDVKLAPDVISHSAAISACEKGGQWQAALQVFEGLLHASITPNVIIYSAAISCCEKVGQWMAAMSLFGALRKEGVAPDTIIYSSLISSCAKGAQWQLAVQLLDAMACDQLAPNVVSYSATISSCEKAGQWESALHLFTAMADARIAANVVSCGAAISACEKSAQWRLALRIFGQMPQCGLEPNLVNCNAALSACEKGGAWLLALHLFSSMPRRLLKPDVLSYNAVINACGRAGQWQLALDMFHGLPEAGLTPSIVSFNSTLSACARGVQWQLALHLFASLPRAQLTPDDVSYNAVLDSLHDKRLGPTLFEEAVEAGIYGNLCAEGPGCLDLHELSPGAAQSAVRWWLTRVLPPVLSQHKRLRCVIITGWGKSRPAWSTSDVQASVLSWLGSQGLPAKRQPGNLGRLTLDLRAQDLSALRGPKA